MTKSMFTVIYSLLKNSAILIHLNNLKQYFIYLK